MSCLSSECLDKITEFAGKSDELTAKQHLGDHNVKGADILFNIAWNEKNKLEGDLLKVCDCRHKLGQVGFFSRVRERLE
jgi:hypothetical protein